MSEWKCVGGTLEQVVGISLYKVISWQESSVSVGPLGKAIAPAPQPRQS